MSSVKRNKTLALAAIFQAAALTDSLARRGYADPQAMKTLLESILVFDTDNPDAIYGSAKHLTLGLQTLEACLGTRNPTNALPTTQLHYALGVIQLEGQLAKAPHLLTTLRQRLEQSQKQLVHINNDITSPTMYSNLASIYVDTLGTMPYRLQIKGSEKHLQKADVPEQIRACLLAGIRAAWLWKRLGGRRWHLLFTRSQVLSELQLLIKEVQGKHA